MSHELLFLLGGPAAFEPAAVEFVPAAGGAQARIALLLQGGAGSMKHLGEYIGPWLRRGVLHYDVIMPGEDGVLDVEAALGALQAATGIMIGGGHTPTYRRLYAEGPIAEAIRTRYRQGVPVAGMSAGALLAPEVCAIPGDEVGDGEMLLAAGLGLVRSIVVGVHYSECNALPGVLDAMARTHTHTAWGLDEGCCAVFADGRFARALGRPAYEITMGDFHTRAHSVTTMQLFPPLERLNE